MVRFEDIENKIPDSPMKNKPRISVKPRTKEKFINITNNFETPKKSKTLHNENSETTIKSRSVPN